MPAPHLAKLITQHDQENTQFIRRALHCDVVPVIADLVPDYLKAIPQDPFTGMNIVHMQ
jgi:hypothetical protein